MKKIIVGMTGLTGSGKSEISNWAEMQEGYSVIRLGRYLRQQNKVNMKYKDIAKYAENYKDKSIATFFEEEILEQMSYGKIIIVDSLRTSADYEYLSSIADIFILVTIISHKKERIDRLLNRKRPGDCENQKELMMHGFWEMDFGLKKLFVMSDYYIINDGKIQDLIQDFRNILVKGEIM